MFEKTVTIERWPEVIARVLKEAKARLDPDAYMFLVDRFRAEIINKDYLYDINKYDKRTS